MRFFGALVLIVVLLFKDTEGSTNFYKKIIKAVNIAKAEEDRMAFTPRPPRGQAATRNTASLEQQSLDLHQYPRAIQEPSPEIDVSLRLGTADTSDVTSRSKTNRRNPSSRGALTIGRTQNDQIQNQEQGGQQEYLREGHVDWLIRQHHDMNQISLQSGEGNMPTDPLRNEMKQSTCPSLKYSCWPPSSRGALTIGRTQNDHIQNQEQGGQQEYLREGHVDWLIQQHHDMNQISLQSGEGNMPTDPLRNEMKQKETRELLMRKKAAKKERKRFEEEMALQDQNSYHHYGNSYPPNPWDPSGGSGYGTQY